MTHPDAPFREKESRQKPEKKPLPLWAETILLLVIALVLAVLIKSFFVQAFYIPSTSMEPLFVKNDRILVEKWSYWGGREPHRGDVIVFADPGGWLTTEEEAGPTNPMTRMLAKVGLFPTGGHLVKRVIGIGGDRVVCCDAHGRIMVNGHPLNEAAYLPPGTKPSLTTFDVRVPDGHVWVMGDNRSDSYDSRGHMGNPGGGFVPDDLIVGKVFALVWPFPRFQFIHPPATFQDLPSN